MLRNQQMQELNRFLHYYTRFRNHENSQKLEEPLLNNVRQKMELLASSLGKGPKGEGTSVTRCKLCYQQVCSLVASEELTLYIHMGKTLSQELNPLNTCPATPCPV